MNIFDEIDENLFRPLTGTNKRKYADILALIWDKCKRMPMYSIEKSTVFDMAEEYLLGLGESVELDIEEQEEVSGNISDMRVVAGTLIRRLRDTGWILEKPGEYEDEDSWLYSIRLCLYLSHLKRLSVRRLSHIRVNFSKYIQCLSIYPSRGVRMKAY